MAISDLLTRSYRRVTARPAVAAGSRAQSLVDLAVGQSGRIGRVAPEAAAALHPHGLLAGEVVTVEARAPFRGPIVVRAGRGRVALARALAVGVLLSPASDIDRGRHAPGRRRRVEPDPPGDARA